MFIEQVTPDQKEYAMSLVAHTNFGQRGRADGNMVEQLTGMIGQTLFADLINAERPQTGEGFDNGTDFIINNKRVDVKTMARTTDMRDYYVHNFVGYQKDYPVDYYVFMSFNKRNDNMTICGFVSKKDFFEKAEYYPKGTRRYRNNGTYFYTRAPLYEIEQTKLCPVTNIEELLVGIR